MFTRLLERKLWASKNEDIIDITFFDEHIRHKFSKQKKTAKTQQETFFLNDKSQNHFTTFECDILAKVEKDINNDVLHTLFTDLE